MVCFDGFWSSSLTDSTQKGLPDIEIVDTTSRLKTISEINRVTSKPHVYDADTGGRAEHIPYLVEQLESAGVSAMVIEDKTGLKKNSLFGNEVEQTYATIQGFQEKLAAAKRAKYNPNFFVIARLEGLILDQGMDDVLSRSAHYIDAGAGAIMIHSRKKGPDEIFEFLQRYHSLGLSRPLMVVPSTFNSVHRSEWIERGVSIVCHANHLLRAAYPAMEAVARSILHYGRSREAEEGGLCMSIKDILELIPGTK